MNRSNLQEEISKITKEISEYNSEDEEDYEQDNLIADDEDIDKFERINLDEKNFEETDNIFINKMHNYYDNWSKWNHLEFEKF